jgi:hypothetical protein
MVRLCSDCGRICGLLEIRKQDSHTGSSELLCSDCYGRICSWKNRILRTFFEGTLKQFCREFSIPTSEQRSTTARSRHGTRYKRYVTYHFTYEELIGKAIHTVSLHHVIEFSKKKGVPIRDILLEIDQYYTKKKLVQEPVVSQINDGTYQKILEKIDLFKPLLPYYPNELPYQIDLARYLLQHFPSAKLEEQRSSARPDIIIDNIAIEIKGPTTERELDTIANKCIRYPLYFEKGLIIVLFDVKVTSRYLEDWQRGLQGKFPQVTIKCK